MVEIDGEQVKLCQGKNNRTEAQRLFHQRMAERLAVPPVDGGNPTVTSVIDAFLEYSSLRDSERTYYERKRYLQLFAEAHGRRLVKECIPFHLRSWVDGHKTWANDWTRSYVIRCVKRPFNWAVKEGLTDRNPFAPVEHRCGEPRRAMTPEEFTKVIRALGPVRGRISRSISSRVRFLEILVFLRYTGARPSELRKMRWTDIDLDRQEIVLTRHKTSRTQRVPAPRRIRLVQPVLRLLTRVLRRGDGKDLVFVTCLKRPWTRDAIEQRLRRLRKDCGVSKDVKIYGLRHLFATAAVLNGVDLKTLAELLGHTTTRVVEQHYVHLADQSRHLHLAMQRAVGLRPGA
jgi:integrase